MLTMNRRLTLTAIVFVTIATACGGGGGKPAASGTSGSASTSGSSSTELAAEVASFDLAIGPSGRFLVGVFSQDHGEVGYGDTQLSFTFLGEKSGAGPRQPGPSADAHFLPVPGSQPATPPAGPAFLRPSEGRGVYEAQVGFDRAGFWEVAVNAHMADGVTRTATADFTVSAKHFVPDVGDPPPATENLTLTTAGVAPAAIDSRATGGQPIPDPELHQQTMADAIAAHRPALVVFATPTFCVSRFCGPVTDMVDGLAHSYADRATFIHVEIWKDFNAQKLNDLVTTWLVQGEAGGNEPWVFLIGADGKIAARWDNVAAKSEIEPLLQALPVIGPA
jgi:hypothetical protein